MEEEIEHSSYPEAIISNDNNRWMTVMHDEMESFEKEWHLGFSKLTMREETYLLQVYFQKKRKFFS